MFENTFIANLDIYSEIIGLGRFKVGSLPIVPDFSDIYTWR